MIMKQTKFSIFCLLLIFPFFSWAKPNPPQRLRFLPEAFRQLNVNYPAIEDAKTLHNFDPNSSIEPVAVYFFSLAEKMAETNPETKAKSFSEALLAKFEADLDVQHQTDFESKISELMGKHHLDYAPAVLIYGLSSPTYGQIAEKAILEFANTIDKLSDSLASPKQ